MEALYFRHHNLEQKDCSTVVEGKNMLNDIADFGEGWAVGVYDDNTKILYLDGFDNIIGADPETVHSRVLRDLKAEGIEPTKLESLN
jgi:hypothetical protein